MKITLKEFLETVKTKTELSVTMKGLWIARSMIGLKINGHIYPLLGFAASFDRGECQNRANFELLEHIAFLPYFYDENSANTSVMYFSDVLEPFHKKSIKDFFIGSRGLYGNGCAISTNKQHAIDHSKRELLERHLCCEIWYKGNRPLYPANFCFTNLFDPNITVTLYTTDLDQDDKFILSALDCPSMGFFALGAAIKPTIQSAMMHATSEVLMLFEDAKKCRNGLDHHMGSKHKILSLRDKATSLQRKKHFEKILHENATHYPSYVPPKCQTIIFEPFDNIFAARSLSAQASDPRNFEKITDIPILPLF